MACFSGPEILNDGLVFCYDQGNTDKSWKGAPTTNLAKNASNVVDWSVSGLTQSVTRSTIVADEVYRITSTSGTGSSFRIYFSNAVLVNGATYTVSYKYKIISGGPQFNANDWCDTSITRTTTALANNTFYETATGTRATYDSTYRFLDFEMSNNTVVEIYDLQLEQRSFATPYTSTQVRSTTQALLDMTGRNTITANSLTYASNGSFSFDGVNNFITTQPIVTFSPNRFTICGFINPNNQYSRFITPNSNGIDQTIEYDNTNQRINVIITEIADVNNRSRSGTAGTVPIGSWSFFAVSIDNLSIKIYVNGILTNEYTETISIGNWDNIWYIGQRGNSANWFSGKLDSLSIYNRALTATEVKQNFEATRGRYGI